MPLVTQGDGGYTWIPSMIGFVDGQILIESETDSFPYLAQWNEIKGMVNLLS